MKTAAAPEKAMAERRKPRLSTGLYVSVQIISFDRSRCSQVSQQVDRAPVLDQNGEDDQDGNGEQVVVVHRVPIFEAGDLDSLSHAEDLEISHAPMFGRVHLHRRQKQCS